MVRRAGSDSGVRMPESERRQRVISSTPRLSPEDVANRVFAKGVRGYSEAEVRSFLRRISEELTASREREQQLTAALDDLEEQLRAPRPLDEQELLDALGEETARLLRSAREAADDIRKRAEERAAHVIEEARVESERLRTDAAQVLASKTDEAEARRAELISEAEARVEEITSTIDRDAEEQRLRAQNEAAEIVETAREQGREMLDEVRGARERVLQDLGRRRSILQAQVAELKLGRDALLDAYRVVKRTFLESTEALSGVEARVVEGRASIQVDADGDGDDTVVEIDLTDTDAAVGEDAASSMADVDSLFARLRAGQDDTPAVDSTTGPESDAVTTPGPEDPAAEVEPAPAAAEAGTAAPAPTTGPAAWRSRHAEGVSGLMNPLVKAAKRAAQDDQNALLDAVRRHKGRPTAAQVLPDPKKLTKTWTGVMQSSLQAAYEAGRVAAGGQVADAPEALIVEGAEAVALPLRDRFAAAIDDVDEGDTSGLVERIGARYREWKNQQLEDALGDMVVAAWSRGVYDASPDGAVLQWITVTEGRCADCDDNALEPTVKGSKFPTGQEYPPAHPGCRCLLAPVDVLAAALA